MMVNGLPMAATQWLVVLNIKKSLIASAFRWSSHAVLSLCKLTVWLNYKPAISTIPRPLRNTVLHRIASCVRRKEVATQNHVLWPHRTTFCVVCALLLSLRPRDEGATEYTDWCGRWEGWTRWRRPTLSSVCAVSMTSTGSVTDGGNQRCSLFNDERPNNTQNGQRLAMIAIIRHPVAGLVEQGELAVCRVAVLYARHLPEQSASSGRKKNSFIQSWICDWNVTTRYSVEKQWQRGLVCCHCCCVECSFTIGFSPHAVAAADVVQILLTATILMLSFYLCEL